MNKMHISFFCILADPIQLNYPLIESLKSIIPVADEIVIAMGRKEGKDEIQELSDKIKIFYWDNWPLKWSYDILIYHYDLALKKCTGDFCIKWNVNWILKYKSEKDFNNVFENLKNYDKINFTKLTYLDKNHWIIDNDAYAINRKKLLEKYQDEDAYFLGYRNNKNDFITPTDINEFNYNDELVKIFNYDSIFLDLNIYLRKEYEWYKSQQLKLNNLSAFNIKDSDIDNSEKLLNLCLDKYKEKIENAVNENRILFEGTNHNPEIILEKVKNINKSNFGFNLFNKIDFNPILYERIPPKLNELNTNIKKIRNYFSKINSKNNFLNGFKTDKDFINAIIKINKEIKISKFS